MIYRKLGRTKLKVSVLGVGGGAFYNPEIGAREVNSVISFAASRGVNFFETAEDYDEAKLESAFLRIKNRILTSKSTAYDERTMSRAVDSSLKKLNLDYLDIYQVQTLTTKQDLRNRIDSGVIKALKKARSNGKIGFIGLSSHRLKTIIAAIKTNEFDVIELPYSIGQYASEEVIDIAKQHDVGVIAIMTLGGGILVDRDGESNAADFMTTQNALSFVLSNKKVSTALVGMSRIEHVWRNINAVSKQTVSLSTKQRNRIQDRVFRFLGKDFCRSCKGCMPCDVHGWQFSIDNFFRFLAFCQKYDYKHFAQEYQHLPIFADKCTECGECEKRCPYNISIMRRLKEAHAVLSQNQ